MTQVACYGEYTTAVAGKIGKITQVVSYSGKVTEVASN